MDLQVIYKSQVNLTGKQTLKDGVFEENPIKARRLMGPGRRDCSKLIKYRKRKYIEIAI